MNIPRMVMIVLHISDERCFLVKAAVTLSPNKKKEQKNVIASFLYQIVPVKLQTDKR